MSRDGGLEASDMNDGDILAKTTQINCPKGGTKFKYVLADGHEITSECVSEDNKRKALHGWVDAVKSAAVSRARAEREEQLARARRNKADSLKEDPKERAKAEAMGLIVPAGTGGTVRESAETISTIPGAVSQRTNVAGSESVSGSVVPSDPVAMAKSQLVQATLEVQELAPKLQSAKMRQAQWKAVLEVLQATELPQEPKVISLDTKFTDLEIE